MAKIPVNRGAFTLSRRAGKQSYTPQKIEILIIAELKNYRSTNSDETTNVIRRHNPISYSDQVNTIQEKVDSHYVFGVNEVARMCGSTFATQHTVMWLCRMCLEDEIVKQLCIQTMAYAAFNVVKDCYHQRLISSRVPPLLSRNDCILSFKQPCIWPCVCCYQMLNYWQHN